MDKQIKGEKHIKVKVLLSYAVFVILISSILFFTFSSFRQLTQSSDALARPNPRTGLLHEIISSLYQAESNIRAYTLNEQEIYLDSYFEDLTRINEKVDSLYELAGEDDFFLQTIDSINIQLLNKTRLLEQFIELKKQDERSVFYDNAIDEIIEVTEEPLVAETTVSPTPADSLSFSPEEIQEEKKNFFAKLRDFFSRPRTETSDPEEESQTEDPALAQEAPEEINADSLITESRNQEELRQAIESTLESLNQSRIERMQILQRRENQILLEDKKVMDRIWEYVTILENYESAKEKNLANTAHFTVKTTTEKIFITMVVFLIVLIAFLWLLVNDVNKSRFYKKQLLREKEKAEDMLLSKQRFIANISHEIRTPLNSIIGFSNQLQRINLENEHKPFVSAIKHSSHHLLDIVNEILDFSRMEAGKIELNPVPLNLAELANEVYQTLSVIARDKNLAFSLETHALKNPFVMADPIRVRQILLNIAGNAIKFTEKGKVGIQLSDSLSESDSSLNHIRIRISDTGIGIPASEQETIFEEFSRVENPLARSQKGTGLGLPISKKLIDAMGGRIELSSKEGEGSAFTIYLTLPVTGKPEPAGDKPPSTGQEKLQARILLVDDDKLNHLLFKSLFGPIPGIGFSWAENAGEALELLKDQKFDLIITDMQMPGISGVKMIRQLRGNSNALNSKTPVIACTADITSENLREIEESGIESYLLKPIDETLLLEKIKEVLSVSQTADDLDLSAKAPKKISPSEGTARNEERPYDLEGLIAFTSDDPNSIVPVIEVFINDTRANLEKLQDYLEQKNSEGIFMVTHKMSNMFGLLQAKKAIHYLQMIQRLKGRDSGKKELRENVLSLIEISKQMIASLELDLQGIAQNQHQQNQ